MTKDQIIAVAGVAATLVGIFITWMVAKKAQAKRQLSYRLRTDSLMPIKLADQNEKLQIFYKNELLVEPILLSVDIANTGNVPIENPPIVIEAVGATYVIPGYFESCPPGYEDLWTIERTDAESCAVRLAHINPGQSARVRLLMDELPSQPPIFKCPMVGLTLKEQSNIEISSFARTVLEIVAPSAAQVLKSLTTR
jgi:hypothetical protein